MLAGRSSSSQQYPDADPAAWRRTLDLNLCAPMELTQRCLRNMTDLGGGAFVNISSSAGRQANPYGSPEYAAAKAGLIRFTSAVADLGPAHGVRVNCVVPGWIGLPRAECEVAAMSPAERAPQAALIPPSQVAEAVITLITDDRLSGRVAVLDGGEAPRRLPIGDEAP